SFPEHAAVAGWIGGCGGEDGHGGTLLQMEIAQAGNCFRLEQRHISGEDEQRIVAVDGGLGGLDGVAGSALLSLLDEVDMGVSDGGFDARGFVSYNDEDVAGRNNLRGGGNDMPQQRLAADFVQNLRTLGLEARALARRHDENCQLHSNRVQHGWRAPFRGETGTLFSFRPRSAHLLPQSGGHGDGDVEWLDGAEIESGQRRLVLRLVAYDQNRELRWVDVLFRHAF